MRRHHPSVHQRAGVWLAAGLLALLGPFTATRPFAEQDAPAAIHVSPGQSVTLLPDGRWLVIGGWRADGSVKPPVAVDGTSAVPIPATLHHQRVGHTATVLPDSSVLVAGGVNREGRAVAAVELFDPRTGVFAVRRDAPAIVRAGHTTTLLLDGRVVIAGGAAGSQTLADALLWDPSSGDAPTAGTLTSARADHSATLLADGRIRLAGGTSTPGAADEIFDPVTAMSSPAGGETDPGFFLSASTPAHGAVDVPVDGRIAVRFSAAVRIRSVNARTVTLTDDAGAMVPADVVAAEAGMLIFVRPYAALEQGRTYSLVLDGIAAPRGQRLSATIAFTTAGGAAAPVALVDDELWVPDVHATNGWRTGRGKSPWEDLPRLKAPDGVTAISGQLLRLNGQPLAGATLKAGDIETRSDRSGRFLVEGTASGRVELVIDGRSAGSAGRIYGVFRVGVDVKAGATHILPYTSWMPRIDTANAMTIPSPTSAETIVRTPLIPGLEVRLPAGTVIRDIDRKVAREVSITPIPVDRPPFPLPAGVDVPIYFTIQPGGAYLEGVTSGWPAGARVIYPNYHALRPATEAEFWNYDPEERGWFVYGLGAVSQDARRIEPGPGVSIYEFTGAMVGSPSFAPPEAPPPCNECVDGDPVDLATGLFVYSHTDVVLPDVVPIELTRTYRTRDTRSRPFGIGSTHAYDIFIVGSTNPWTYADIVLPDGGRVHYPRTSAGTNFNSAVYEHTSSAGPYHGSRISWNSQKAKWDLRFRDGTIYTFPDAEFASTPAQAAVVAIQDRFGNVTTLDRDVSSRLTRVTSPNGRFIDITYGTSDRISQVRDNVGRVVGYEYDASGRLWKVTDQLNGVTEYSYDSSDRMKTIKDPRGITYLTNDYDLSGRVILQRQADGSTYQFAYTTSGGAVTQTDVTDPRGMLRRVTFNSAGYWLTDTKAVGRTEQQTMTLVRQPATNLVASSTDALGRRTEYGYDVRGNLTSVIRLADTEDPITSSATYDTTFNRMETATDGLTHTTSYTYDSRGALTRVTDPLGHAVNFGVDASGQVASVSDAAGTRSLTYLAGDLVGAADGAGQTMQRLVDNAGRELTRTDPLGNRVRREHDALNRILSLTDPLQGTTVFTYDGNGNMLTARDARNGLTQYTYDALGRVATRKDALLNVERYIYDQSGNVFQFVDRRGLVSTYHYDGLNRLVQAAYADGATTTYTYDAGNRLRTAVDSVSGTITLNYDALDRLTSEVTPRGTVSYTYDNADRRATMTVLGQPTVTYTYDDADRITQITQGTLTATLTYDDADRRTSATLPNGVTVEYGYDAASRLSALTYRHGQTVLGTLTYAYDSAGRRIEMGGTLARVDLPQPVTSASYNGANQLTQWNGVTLTYDQNGNLLTEGTRTYSWDARNRMSAIGGGTPAAFSYDAVGRRTEKATPSGTVGYLHDGLQTVQELSGTTPTANLFNGPALDEVLVRTDAGGSVGVLPDALGSTVALTDAAGAFTTRYSYEPFGTSRAAGPSTVSTAQFTGRESDSNGLLYYRARYYSPRLHRFVSEDPIGWSSGDANFYSYVGASPTNWADPLGLSRSNSLLDWLQTLLDAGGLVPGVGEPLDLLNAGISAARGDSVGAGLSVAAMIPVGGQAATAAKVARRFEKNVEALIDLAKQCKRKGVTPEEADTLRKWADEYGVPSRGPEQHSKRNYKDPHIHVGPVDHITVR